MRITNSMKYLTQKIEYGAKKRKESVSSMINNYKSIRLNEGTEDRTNRILYIAKLKSNVRNLLLNDFNARKAMSSDRRQSFNIFMNNLKSSTTSLLNTFREKQNSVAADILGARIELAALVQLQKKNVSNTNDENTGKYLSGSDCNAVINTDICLSDSDCNTDKLLISDEIPNDENCSDDVLSKKIFETSNGIDSVIQDSTIVQEVIKQQTDSIENIVSDFIKESKEGKKLVEIREFINSIDENIKAQEILYKMCTNGIIKKFRYRYYIINNYFKEN